MSEPPKPLVAVIMGSKSDWETMRHAAEMLTEFEVMHECRVVSAHRTPTWLAEFAGKAESRGIEVIIAGAGGGHNRPGRLRPRRRLPGRAVPVGGLRPREWVSWWPMVQFREGIPVARLGI